MHIELDAPVSIDLVLGFWIQTLQDVKSGDLEFFDQKHLLMVKGMDGDDEEFTQVDLNEDLVVNLLDGTWHSPQIWAKEPVALPTITETTNAE